MTSLARVKKDLVDDPRLRVFKGRSAKSYLPNHPNGVAEEIWIEVAPIATIDDGAFRELLDDLMRKLPASVNILDKLEEQIKRNVVNLELPREEIGKERERHDFRLEADDAVIPDTFYGSEKSIDETIILFRKIMVQVFRSIEYANSIGVGFS